MSLRASDGLRNGTAIEKFALGLKLRTTILAQ